MVTPKDQSLTEILDQSETIFFAIFHMPFNLQGGGYIQWSLRYMYALCTSVAFQKLSSKQISPSVSKLNYRYLEHSLQGCLTGYMFRILL